MKNYLPLLFVVLATCHAFLLPLQPPHTFLPINGTLDLVMVATNMTAPLDLQLVGDLAQVWIFQVCARGSLGQMDCNDSPPITTPFHGIHLALSPGDTLKIRLVNRLPISELGPTRTNLHFHGQLVDTHSTGGTFGDYVFVECYNSFQEPTAFEGVMDKVEMRADFIDYVLAYPANHPLGLFWFHPHNHMSGAMNGPQINAGLSGVITIGPPPTGNDIHHLVLRSTFVEPDGQMTVLADPFFCDPLVPEEAFPGYCPGTGVHDGGKLFVTVNGQVMPILTVPATGGQVWRVTQSVSSISFFLELRNDADGSRIAFQVLKEDGILTGLSSSPPASCAEVGVVCADSIFVMPASRVDLFLESSFSSTEVNATLYGVGPVMGPGGDEWPSVILAKVRFTPGGNASQALVHPLVTYTRPVLENNTRFAPAESHGCEHPLPSGHIRRILLGVPLEEEGEVSLSEEDEGFAMQYEELYPSGAQVRGTRTQMVQFNPKKITICAKLGGTEVWEIVNVSPEHHNFHIHQTQFRVINQSVEFGGGPFRFDTYVDTVPVAANSTTVIEIPFLIPGDYLYHCHIAEHSNNGMMGKIRVTSQVYPDSLYNPFIIAIVARELIEMSILVISHFGSVLRRNTMEKRDKNRVLCFLFAGFFSGIVIGLVVSVAVCFAVSAALDSSYGVMENVEIAEAISKTIAAYFVSAITLKIPRWFGFSNFVKPPRPTKIAVQNGETVIDDDAKELAFSLFWNSLRETTEGGIFTGLTYLLSTTTIEGLGSSVGVGFAVAICLCVVFGLGGYYLSSKVFGIIATGLAILLSAGLVTGAVGEYEAIRLERQGTSSGVVFSVDSDTASGVVLNAFGFMGLNEMMTPLTFCALFLTIFVLLALQVWHNYYGRNVVGLFSWVGCLYRRTRVALRPKEKTGDIQEDLDNNDDEEKKTAVRVADDEENQKIEEKTLNVQ